MPKLKHHFVPRMYLKLFASAPKRIHLYNLDRDVAIRDVSLRDQCYRHRFYGETDEVEDALADFESPAAHILQEIVKTSSLPKNESEEQVVLLFFVTIQLLRTSLTAERLNSSIDKMMKQAFRDDRRLKGVDLESISVGFDNPVLQALRNTPIMAHSISDLQMHLICATQNQFFITSDNPVFRYNQYYENVKGFSMTGGMSRGLQIFLPLSPQHILMLYDSTVYKVDTRKKNISQEISDQDTDVLNILQIVSSDQNLYFHDWSKSCKVVELAGKGKKYRKSDVVHVEELEEVGNEENSRLLHLFERTPNLRLKLSFINLQKRARQVPLNEKLLPNYRYRKELPDLTRSFGEVMKSSIKRRTFGRKPKT